MTVRPLDPERCSYCGGAGPEIEPFGYCAPCTREHARSFHTDAEGRLEILATLVAGLLGAAVQPSDIIATVRAECDGRMDDPPMTLAGLHALQGAPLAAERARAFEALALLDEIADDRQTSRCMDVRPDILARLDAWIKHHGEHRTLAQEAE